MYLFQQREIERCGQSQKFGQAGWDEYFAHFTWKLKETEIRTITQFLFFRLYNRRNKQLTKRNRYSFLMRKLDFALKYQFCKLFIFYQILG